MRPAGSFVRPRDRLGGSACAGLPTLLARRDARLDKRPRSLGAAAAHRREFTPAQGVVVAEERLDLVQQARPQVFEAMDMGMRAGLGGDREEAVVAFRLAVSLPLLRLDHA